MALHDYYYTPDPAPYDPKAYHNRFNPPGTWFPPLSQITSSTVDSIDLINKTAYHALNHLKFQRNGKTFLKHPITQHNLSTSEKQALKHLQHHPHIIVKSADKGGAVVVMDRTLYIQEAFRQLHNTDYYRPIPAPIYPQTAVSINQILLQLRSKGHISAKQFSYLSIPPHIAKSRYFYLLPKIHKARSSWPNPHMPAGRPIVSDCASESSKICEFIDYFLQPLSIRHPAYIKDTYDFVNKIRDLPIHPDHLLFTADVTALYTNMKPDLIIQAIQDIFKQYPDPTRPDSELLQLLSLTLYNNDFEFLGQFYLQTCGIAMGRRYAPSAANIYLQPFDNLARTGFHIKPLLYYRFLDDIFGTWPGTATELLAFQDYLNSLIPGISVTFTYKTNIIDFLDTRIYKYTSPSGLTTLQTKVFFKPTDTHQLLHKTSFHASHTFTSILRCQFIRFKRISSTFQDFQEASSVLINVLTQRGYSRSLLLRNKRDIWHNYTQPLHHPSTSNSNSLPVITHFDNIHWHINKQWCSIIRNNPLFQNLRIISSLKRHKNLGNLLCKGRLLDPSPPDHSAPPRDPPNPTTTHNSAPLLPKNLRGCTRCTNPNCKACNFITESKTFTSSYTKRIFKLYNSFTCKSTNLVYLITCLKCDKQYVGETGRSLSQRTTDHLSSIRLNKPTPIGLHFNLTGHSIHHFSILPIQQIDNSTNPTVTRRTRELRWQNILHTLHPLGINNPNTDNRL